ncbi:MAG: hypothetical protein GY826_18425, partial [Fuerstiella sp.]|nr:hypothetical protein [Fuerstiella sp.]
MGRNATQIGQRILISAVFLFSLTKVVAGPQPNTAVDSAEPRRLLTGKALRDALDDRRGETSQGISLGQAVRSLQTDTGIAIVLDRRVDPSRLVDASTEYVTTRTSISAFAESATASASFADDFVVIGPVVATTRFRTLAAINRKSILNMRHELDAELYRSLSKSHDWSWPDLAEPRRGRAAHAQLQTENLAPFFNRFFDDTRDEYNTPPTIEEVTLIPETAFAGFPQQIEVVTSNNAVSVIVKLTT